jgi:hypothetical protein
VAGWDACLTSPWRALPVAVYAQLMGADAVGGFPDDYFALFGAEAWHAILGDALVRAHLEWVNTSCRYYLPNLHYYCAYADNQYFQGDRYRGFPIGDSLDEDSEASSARIEVTLSDGQSWSLMGRAGALNRNPNGDPENSLTRVREQIRELILGWRRNFGDYDVSLGIGALHENQPTLGASNNPLEAYASWNHRL